jgi:subtilase family serine protease
MSWSRYRSGLVALAVVSASLFLFMTVARMENRLQVGQPGSKLASMLGAKARGSVLPDLKIRGSIHFRLNNEAELDRLLEEQQDLQSDNYRRWLAPREFGRRFGVSPEVYRSTLDWFESAGITPTRLWANRLGIEFEARADHIEQAFGVRMQSFELEGRTYYANDEPPQLPEELATEVRTVRLHNFKPLRALASGQTGIVADFRASGRTGISPKDFYTAYNLSPLIAEGLDGAGQTIGIALRSDFDLKDIGKYREIFNLPPAEIVKISAGGDIVNLGGGDEIEALLDSQLAGMAAPRAKLQAVISDKDSDLDQSVAFLVNNLPDTKVINISFSGCEREILLDFGSVFDNLYKQGAAQGQTILVASGDTGVDDCRDGTNRVVNGLASSPFVTGVGGTSLTVDLDNNGNVTAYKGERVWNGGGFASGGGLSVIHTRPVYQQGLTIPEGTTRALPDIALVADANFNFFFVRNGNLTSGAGTSFSAPAWAGIFALINQFAKTNGLGPVNPRIYQMGTQQQQGGTAVYNDILEGNNGLFGLPGFIARKGYDLSTGWGSPNGDLFVRNFAGMTDPGSGIFLLQPNGGEFLQKGSTISVRWRINDALASNIVSQDVLLSTDGGGGFQPIASRLGADARSFDFTSTDLVTPLARFRIMARTSAGAEVVDSSDTDVNIGTELRIKVATYSLGLERLEIIGNGFTEGAKVIINGKMLKKKPSFKFGDTLVLTGSLKKLKLKEGENQIVVKIGSLHSAPARLLF